MTTAEAFGAALSEARSRAGLSLRQTANQLNELGGHRVGTAEIHNWEKARRPIPSARMIEHLAEVLGTDPVMLCVAGGKVPTAVSEALTDLEFVETVYPLALAHLRTLRLAS